MTEARPHGSWRSPIAPDLLVARAVGLSYLVAEARATWASTRHRFYRRRGGSSAESEEVDQSGTLGLVGAFGRHVSDDWRRHAGPERGGGEAQRW